jgi:hypothetical protein
MAYRPFSIVDIWFEEWFLALTTSERLFYRYIYDRCDAAGIWGVSASLGGFAVGKKLDIDEFIKNVTGHVLLIEDGVWWIPNVFKEQHDKIIQPYWSFHRPIVKQLIKYDLLGWFEDAIIIKKVKEKSEMKSEEKAVLRFVGMPEGWPEERGCRYKDCLKDFDGAPVRAEEKNGGEKEYDYDFKLNAFSIRLLRDYVDKEYRDEEMDDEWRECVEEIIDRNKDCYEWVKDERLRYLKEND